MNEKLELIRQACIAANPNRRWEDLGNCKRHWADDFSQTCSCPPDSERKLPCRLADVLLAIKSTHYALDSEGEFMLHADGSWHYAGPIWNLRNDDLSQQSNECIEFLYDLLKPTSQ
jgi:hypothetical protein